MDKVMKYDYKKILEFVKRYRLPIVVIILFFIVSLSVYLFVASRNNISKNSLTTESSVNSDKSGANYNIYTKGDYLFKSSKSGEEASKDFIQKNPFIDGKKILPDDFLNNSQLTRKLTDPKEGELAKQLKNNTGEHYYYSQKVGGLPIFSSNVSIHLKNGNEIYSVGGNVTFNKKVTEEKISEDEAKKRALEYAKDSLGTNANLSVSKVKKMVFNKKIVGISDDDTNYVVLVVEIVSSQQEIVDNEYYVSLSDGKVLFVEELIHEALNRDIRDCNHAPYNGKTCSILVGKEGSPPQSLNSDASDIYQYFGDIYNYYKSNFGRDSYDNNGGKLLGNVHLDVNYKNAFWNGTQMFFGDNMVILDVTAHEFTHGITQRTAGLIYSWQSGAMNEAISDIFGSALDNNWTLGEGSALGVIRRMDDPTQSKTPQPDKVFSSRYYCVSSGVTCDKSNDMCGVHRNSGVLNKAFYLMTDGGSFNGCNISGLGRTKAHAVIYRALTTYLTASSNFSQAYSQILSACNDLYGSTSNECGQVKAAMQATEMDQQPAGSQVGAACSGVTPKKPVCAGGTTTAGEPTPTTVSGGGAGSSTGGAANGKHTISGIVYIDSNKNLTLDSNESGIANVPLVLEGPTSGNVNSDSVGVFSFSDLSSGNYKLVVKAGSISLLEYPNIDVTQNGVSYSIDIPIFPEMQKLLDELNPTSNNPTATPGTSTTGSSNSLTPSPTPITIYDCKQKTKTQTVAGKQIQISYLDCTPTGTVQPKTPSQP